jgi:hypothetical protein
MRLIATLKPTRMSTRLLITRGGDDVLKAVLPPARQADPRAAEMLIEALSLWFQTPLSVVLYADAEGTSAALALCDEFGFGKKTVHFDVEVYDPRQRRGLGAFDDLRQLTLRGVQ